MLQKTEYKQLWGEKVRSLRVKKHKLKNKLFIIKNHLVLFFFKVRNAGFKKKQKRISVKILQLYCPACFENKIS